MQLFGTSGIRTVFDKNLIQLAMKVGLTVGEIYGNAVLGSDTRTSSDAMKHALISGLLAAGARCYDAGVTPTPTLAFATREFAAGAMIYVVVEELIPESQLEKNTHIATIGAMLGFAVMMTLDVALG